MNCEKRNRELNALKALLEQTEDLAGVLHESPTNSNRAPGVEAMEFRIADTFTESLARLPAETKRP